MLFHIAEDEKFLDSVIPYFEELNPGNNIYIVTVPSEDYVLKYTTSDLVVCATYNSEKYKRIIGACTNSDSVIFHNAIMRYKWDLLTKLPKETKKVWIAWGMDLYSSGKLVNTFYKRKTRKHARRIQKAKTTLKGPFKGFLYEMGSRIPMNWIIKLGLIDNIQNYFKYFDYMSPVIYEDFELLKKHYPKANFEHLPFNYNINSNIYSNLDLPINSGQNILIGNSASPVNNHIDTFELLKSIPLKEDQKIIVPLSYGGDKKYIETVIQQGLRYFGDHFVPLTNFMPKEEYQELLQSIGFGFFNSLRQHAMGNISILLFQGAKIFLDEKNPAHKFYSSNNIKIRSINLPKKTLNEELGSLLDKSEVRDNRVFLFKRNNEEAYRKKIDAFIKEVTK